MRIIGIDPGTRQTGFACIIAKQWPAYTPKDFRLADMGILQASDRAPLNQRLGDLHDALYQIATEFKPDLCAMESSFLGPNPQSALKLGHVRGAFIAALWRHKVTVSEIYPNTAKKLITGQGHASKELVSQVLEAFGYPTPIAHDASDALAIAIAFGLSQLNKANQKLQDSNTPSKRTNGQY